MKPNSLIAIVSLFITITIVSFTACQEKELVVTEVNPIDHSYQFSEEIEDKWKDSDEPWRFQAAGSEFSYIGNYKKVSDNFYKDVVEREELNDSSYKAFQKEYKSVSAIDYILKRAENEQIVIVNEAHHKPKHRVVTKKLLQELYSQGFRYFGAETLNKLDVDRLNLDKYPVYKSGTYSIEPEFGNLLREALSTGYKLFAYEGEGNGKPREISQAKNIQAFMDENEDGKVLIHCGYQHAMEGDIKGDWEKAMAGRLFEYTGINPLTINQTAYDNRFEFRHLSPLQKRIGISEPTVFVDTNDLSYLGKENDKGYDVFVFHEQNTYENNRPNWLIHEGRNWVEVNLVPLKLEQPYFLFAFNAVEDYEKAIPVDLIEVQKITDKVYFSLAEGSYQIVAQSKTNKALSFQIEVK